MSVRPPGAWAAEVHDMLAAVEITGGNVVRVVRCHQNGRAPAAARRCRAVLAPRIWLHARSLRELNPTSAHRTSASFIPRRVPSGTSMIHHAFPNPFQLHRDTQTPPSFSK